MASCHRCAPVLRTCGLCGALRLVVPPCLDWIGSGSCATLSGGQSSTPLLIEATANPNPSNFDITLNFTGAGGSWPADMAVAITDPNGVCVAFGGYNDSPSGCSSLGNYTTIWPTDWNTSTSGTY